MITDKSNPGCCPPMQLKKILAHTDGALGAVGITDITFTIPHGIVVEPAADGFVIHIWSSPVEANDVPAAARVGYWGGIFGNKDICRDPHGFGRWAEGTPVKSPEGIEVGAFNEHNLYIYFDAAHNGTNDEFDVYRHILQQAIDGMVISTEENMSREAYVEFCSKRFKFVKEAAKEQTFDLTKKVEQLNAELIEAIRMRDAVYRQSVGMKAEDNRPKYAAEFDALAKSPKIKKLFVKNHMIIVETAMIYVSTSPRYRYEIGEFQIRINTQNGFIRFINKTRTVKGYSGGMHHPHIFPDGHACWGNLDSSVAQYIAQHEYAALITVVIAFLESVDIHDGAGQYIRTWPKAKKEVKVKRKKAVKKKVA